MIKLGVADEAFKHYSGVFFDSSLSQIRRFPKELWPKYPDLFAVPGGRELFGQNTIGLTSLRGGWAAFQMALSSDRDFTVALTPRAHFPLKRGCRLLRVQSYCECPGLTFTLQLEDTISDDDRSRKCDILLRTDYASYERDAVAMIWAELHPGEAEPGIYGGGVKVYESDFFGNERFAGEITFTLRVQNLRRPDIRNSAFELNLWQHNSNLSRQHEVGLFSDEHFAVLAHYIAALAKLGQRSVSVIASDAPWAGQMSHRAPVDDSDMFEYNMIRVEKLKDGTFHYDYSAMQRYIDLCFSHGIDRHIEVFGLCGIWHDPEYGFGKTAPDHPDAVRIRYLDRADGCQKWMDRGGDIDAYMQALEQYFVDKGLIGKVLISCDEPLDTELYARILDRIKSVCPRFRYVAAINHVSHITAFKQDIDSFSVILPGVGLEWEELKAIRDRKDKLLTWYVCCGPKYPNMFVSSHLLESRLIGWLTDHLGLDGFLRWDFTVLPRNPRQKLAWQTFRVGDGNFVYPGNDGKPLLSLRYKQLLRGVEDYCLMERLRALSPEKAAETAAAVAALLFKKDTVSELLNSVDWQTADGHYNLTIEAFEQARDLVAEAIMELEA